MRGVEHKHLKEVDGDVDFFTVSRIVTDIGARYSSFNDVECRDLKRTMISMKGLKAGRVRLPDFYKMGLHSHWELTEKVEYLRALGALDESNASSPSVIIPNYMGARPNCLEASNLYAVCCRNECEDLMGHLETGIAASAATPHHIAELISKLGSDTAAPRPLSASMLERLNSIAAHHDGKVRLHGRLFAQWMHHVYPNECPFPHEAGKANPLTPDEWISADVSASREERQKIVDADSCTAEGPGASAEELPWSDAEELLAEQPLAKPAKQSEGQQCGVYLAFALTILTVYAMLSAQCAEMRQLVVLTTAKHGISWQLLLVGWFSTLALVMNLVDRGLFAFVICGGLVSNYMAKQPKVAKSMKCEKSLV